MGYSCRKALDELDLSSASNAGLLLARYLKVQKEEGTNNGEQEREKLLEAAVKAAKLEAAGVTVNFYKTAFDRRKEILGGTVGTLQLHGRLVIGLGASNILETGLTLNPIYGTPLIPGSALKGLASHYCASVWGANNPDFKGPERDLRGNITRPAGKYHDFMFGSTEDAGFLTFHDAWIKPGSLVHSLVQDVMTPHHGNYYMKKTVTEQQAAPTDFDDPNPVTFLSIKGEFEIHVSCDHSESQEQSGKSWELCAVELLKQAIENWGIGGKTSSGYGIGALKYERPPSAATVPELAGEFIPGQKVEVLYRGVNKKGNHQVKVEPDEKKRSVRWEGAAPNVKAGEKFQAIVKSYDRNANPELILCLENNTVL
jgi:CRISPR-associated protein Cmr6